jgi:hypothetical protein
VRPVAALICDTTSWGARCSLRFADADLGVVDSHAATSAAAVATATMDGTEQPPLPGAVTVASSPAALSLMSRESSHGCPAAGSGETVDVAAAVVSAVAAVAVPAAPAAACAVSPSSLTSLSSQSLSVLLALRPSSSYTMPPTCLTASAAPTQVRAVVRCGVSRHNSTWIAGA